ncbi:MAG: ABC transporter ATP-binding protein [Rhodovibrionaceae bacterium]
MAQSEALSSGGEPLVAIRDLGLAYHQNQQLNDVLHHVSMDIKAGEIVGLVGESGCGKSSLSLLLLGFRHPAARIRSGEIRFKGQDLLTLPNREITRLRGNKIGFVPQNPTTALNPGMRVGAQIAEALTVHGKARGGEALRRRIVELFENVGLPEPRTLLRRYPHELSGGQQQRVTIAMALACGPDLLVLDEPTTGLDVTTQEQIILLLKSLRAQYGMAMLYVTHDLGVLAEIADRISVMYAGHLVEAAPTEALFAYPRHPYTRGLIGSIPRIDGSRAREGRLTGYLDRREIPPGCPFQPRCPLADEHCPVESQYLSGIAENHAVACRNWQEVTPLSFDDGELSRPERAAASESLLEVSNLTLRYDGGGLMVRLGLAAELPAVVREASFEIDAAEVVALVGESGSGKSTIARAISGLLEPAEGEIRFHGAPLQKKIDDRPKQLVSKIQFIFQNPDASLNPRQSVGRSLARPIEVFFGRGRSEAGELVAKALEEVMLSSDYARRYPDQLSGGERQRIAIARALVAEPDLLLCDEVLSALDVSVQANVLDLLERLRSETSVAMLFISHDLAVVRRLADRVCVLYHGQMMEQGRVAAVFAPPYHPYTLTLLMSVPGSPLRKTTIEPAAREERKPEPQGCAFAGRCPWQPDERCYDQPPPLHRTEGGLAIRCHLPLDDLMRIGLEAEENAPSAAQERKAGNLP